MHRKLPKASNLANTINVVQGQMLEKKYECYPYCDNLATLCIVEKCTAVIFSCCGLWSAITDAMIPCVKEAIFKLQQQ